MSAPHAGLTPASDDRHVHAVLERVRRAWRHLGVRPQDRRVMADALHAELRNARATGRQLHEVTGRDIGGFAARRAHERDALRTGARLLRTGGGLLGLVGLLAVLTPRLDAVWQVVVAGAQPVLLALLVVELVRAPLAWLRSQVRRAAFVTASAAVIAATAVALGVAVYAWTRWPEASPWTVEQPLPAEVVAGLLVVGVALSVAGWAPRQRRRGGDDPGQDAAGSATR